MIQPRVCATFCLAGALAGAALWACDDDDDGAPRARGTLQPEATIGNAASGAGGAASVNGGTGMAGGTSTSAGAGGSVAAAGGATATGLAGSSGAASSTPTGAAGDSAAGSAGSATALVDAGALLGPDAGAVLALEDAQIYRVVDTLNAGEVDQARAALPQLNDAELRDFAEDMIEEHGGARERVLQLAGDQGVVPADSQIASDLQAKSDAAVDLLLGAAPMTIDALYIQLQLGAHVEAVMLLDQLVVSADSEPLRAELTALRASVQSHLDRARALNDSEL